MKINFIISFVFLILFSEVFSGQIQKKEFITSYGLVYGANSARIDFLGERQKARVSQFFGIELDHRLKSRFFISGMVLYAPKTAYYIGSTVLKKNSIDIVIAPTLKIDDLTFKTGLVIERVSSITSRNRTSSRVKIPLNIEEPTTDMNAFVSAEVKANELFNIFIQASIPTKRRASSTIGVGLKFKINQKQERQISDRERIKKDGIRQINNLKEGVLLVRLKTSINKIEALQKVGLKEQSQLIERAQRNQNLDIIRAFRRHYKFNEVQFFYSTHTKEVKKKELKNIFLDESLKIDSTITIEGKPFLIAEYTTIERDTARYYSHTELKMVGNFQAVSVDRYYGSPDFNFLALVIKNENFEQMVEPFPYYSKYNDNRISKDLVRDLFGFRLITSSFDEAVKKLDQKLYNFYLRHNIEQ